MNHLEILEKIKELAKDVLIYAFSTDEVFPYSCGLVSGIISRLIYLDNILPEYNIYYIRGERMRPDTVFCNIKDKKISTIETCIHCKKCSECWDVDESLDFHSWIEVEHKETKEKCILDYTVMQFDENICLYEKILEERGFNRDELYSFMENIHPFNIKENDTEFKWYMNIYKKILNGEDIPSCIADMKYFIKTQEIM